MKHCIRLLMIALSAALAFWGCERAEEPDWIEAFLVDGADLSDGSAVVCKSEASVQTLTFSTNRDWRISKTDRTGRPELAEQSDQADWISLSETTGKAGENSVEMTLEENYDGKERSCSFTVTAGTVTKSYAVVQETAYVFEVSDELFEVGAEESSISLTVTSNTKYNVSLSDGCGWISRVITKGVESGKLSFTIAENTDFESREASIILSAENGTSLYVSVKQKGNWVFSVNKTSFTLESAAANISVEVKTNMKLEVSFSEGCDWIKQVLTKGVIRDEITFSVSDNNLFEDREARIILRAQNDTCRTFTVKQKARDFFKVSETSLKVPSSGGEISVTVNSNLEYSVISMPDWVKVKSTATIVSSTVKTHHFNASENSSSSSRTGVIMFRSSKKDTAKVTVTQKNNSFNGIVKQLRKASVGNGIDIVITGDAYLNSAGDMAAFDSFAAKGMSAIFDEEPFKSLSNRFNVYSVKATSATDVIGSDTRFSTRYGSGTLIGGDDVAVFGFVSAALPSLDLTKTLIITILNDDKYAGTCYLYSDNKAIAYVPANSNAGTFGNLIRHEAGGHGFGKLADEYFHGNETVSNSKIISYNYWKSCAYGFYENIDITDDPSAIKWAKFINDPNYSGTVGIFEGGFTYCYGVYRPSENSIMRHNTGGYNAPSREAIYKKAMMFSEGSGWVYDFAAFVAFDSPSRTWKVKTADAAERFDAESFIPLAPPVMIQAE